MDCYGNTISTYMQRDTPTRLTRDIFEGRILSEAEGEDIPNSNDYKDPYGPTPCGFWIEEDFALERKNWQQRKMLERKYAEDIAEKGWSHIDTRLFITPSRIRRVEVTLESGVKIEFDSVPEVAEYLGVTSAAVYKWIRGDNGCTLGHTFRYLDD